MMCIFINSAGEARLSRLRLLHMIVLCSSSINAPALYKADHDAYTKKNAYIQKNVTRGAYTKKRCLVRVYKKMHVALCIQIKLTPGVYTKKISKFKKFEYFEKMWSSIQKTAHFRVYTKKDTPHFSIQKLSLLYTKKRREIHTSPSARLLSKSSSESPWEYF